MKDNNRISDQTQILFAPFKQELQTPPTNAQLGSAYCTQPAADVKHSLIWCVLTESWFAELSRCASSDCDVCVIVKDSDRSCSTVYGCSH